MLLDEIREVGDIRKIPPEQYAQLAQEIRDFLIEKVSVTGGHLGPNLGVVELTMALHLELNLPEDKLIWDVGHQSYTHKILTGRKAGFEHLRQFGGMSGFPKRKESDCDCFDTGHSSTSISAAIGMAAARDMRGTDETIVAVIGDGSLTGGMAYEALNNAGKMDTNLIIVLNDNNMSISENVGGIPKYLNSIRTSVPYLDLKKGVYDRLVGSKTGDGIISTIRRAKNSVKSLIMPGMLFEEMGIVYLGPVDGHNIEAVRRALQEAKHFERAVLVHVITQKGKGYAPAERHPARFHGTSPFEVETGVPKTTRNKANWTDIFSTVMFKMGERDPKLVAVTAAMSEGTGLKRFRNKFPDRLFDVGIAEQHAVTFAAGLAAGGYKPVVAIYSSFLQRAYDQVLHDVCIQQLPVIFAIDRAGLVGADGETHQGIFDLSYLGSIPGLVICAPKNKWELSDMLKFAMKLGRPIAIRYPRGEAYDGLEDFRSPIEEGRAEWIYREDDIVLLALGSMVPIAEQVRDILKERGMHVSLINARFAKPIDEEIIREACRYHSLLVTMEDNVEDGGFGERVLDFMSREGIGTEYLNISIPNVFVPHGSVDLLRKELRMDAASVAERIIAKVELEL
ncbi:MAG: 1-deoxy-D-xylulose-5-phosphate synthase [Lachnospiraceae bacterium]|nr:1-deoxy-D-xylulose-5-phosphate synthase [Lachnospiraceae bacterium]